MNVFRLVVVTAVILVVLILLVSLFLPRHFTVLRRGDVRASGQRLYNHLRHLQYDTTYDAVFRNDTITTIQYLGAAGRQGAGYQWKKSAVLGTGTKAITRLVPGRLISGQINILGPQQGTLYYDQYIEPVGDDCSRLVWRVKGMQPYPLNFLNLFIVDCTLGRDIQQSISTLDTLAKYNLLQW